MSTSTDRLVSQDSPGERRFYPRVTPTRLIYIGFGANNVGMLLNIGENGMLVSTPMGLKVNSAYRVSIRLNGLPNPIEVNVCVVWTTESRRRSGIQMLDLSDFDREQIRKWGALETGARDKAPEPVAAQPAIAPQTQPAPQTATKTSQPAGPEREACVAPPPVDEPPRVAPAAAKRPERPAPPVHAPTPVLATTAGADLPRVADPAAAPLAPPAPRQLDFPPSHHLAAIQRTRQRSGVPALIAWGALGATLCGAAAVFFVPSLSQRFLTPLGLHTQAPTVAYVPAPPESAGTEAPASPSPNKAALAQTHMADSSTHRRDSSSDAALPGNADARPFGSKLTAPRPVRQNSESAANTNDAADSNSPAPDLTANEATSALPSKIGPENQPVAPPAAASPQPTGVVNAQASAKPPAAPNSSAAAGRSAITGSITNLGTQPTDLSAGNPAPSAASPNNTGSAWAGSRAPASAGRSSLFHPNSNSGVVNMDPGEDTVTEITVPRRPLASYMNLPGERVLESPGITMHIQRSIRVPADRWILLHNHKKLVLGKLTSRVDPQANHLPPGSGTVTVEASVDKDGNVMDVKPLNGASAFLPAVTKAVRQWRYEPTYIDNKPVETRAQIVLDFHPQSVRNIRP
jgi:Gram-negative bacterial TonB protein C-terminal